jgi:hypothetical protein
MSSLAPSVFCNTSDARGSRSHGSRHPPHPTSRAGASIVLTSRCSGTPHLPRVQRKPPPPFAASVPCRPNELAPTRDPPHPWPLYRYRRAPGLTVVVLSHARQTGSIHLCLFRRLLRLFSTADALGKRSQLCRTTIRCADALSTVLEKRGVVLPQPNAPTWCSTFAASGSNISARSAALPRSPWVCHPQ